MFTRCDYFLNCLAPDAVSFEKEMILNANERLLLRGYDRRTLAPLFSEILRNAKEHELPVEVIHHPLDNQIKGVFLPTKSKFLLCEDSFGIDVLDRSLCKKEKIHLEKALTEAQDAFHVAHKIHDEKESLYMKHMDFELSDILCNALIQRILRNQKVETVGEGKVTERFFGAPLAMRNIDYIEPLTANLQKRYLLKGRPGSGKSTFLKKVAAAILEKGIDVEIYHCSMDPNSVDMIIARELSVALFDCTAPHEYPPIPEKDEIIDLYKECLPIDIDERNEALLSDLNTRYKAAIQVGRDALQKLLDAEYAYFESLEPVPPEEAKTLFGKCKAFLFD